MSVQFVWEEKYEVGCAEIDEQHKGIFELASSLSDDMGEMQVKVVIMELYRYTHDHFTSEEMMMKKLKYPELEEHKAYHNDLVVRLNRLSKSIAYQTDDIYTFKKFVYDWLIDHIMHKDMDFFRFVRNLPDKK